MTERRRSLVNEPELFFSSCEHDRGDLLCLAASNCGIHPAVQLGTTPFVNDAHRPCPF
jgi:hypothetical protein